MSAFASFNSEKIQECAGWLQDCTAVFNGRFKGQKLYHPEIAVYLKAVCCPDPDKVIEALKHWLLNERHFPAPIDIRLRIRQIDAGEKRQEAEQYIMLESAAFDDEKIQECASWLRDCTIIFNGPKLSHHDVAVYLKAVCCPDPDKVIEVLKRWLPNERHFPAPIDIRQLIEQKISDKEYIALESTPLDNGKHRECVHLLRWIADLCDAPHLSDPDIAAYFNAVNCTDADKVYQALDGWLGRGPVFPSPEDIRSRIRKLDEGETRPENKDEISLARPRSPASGILKASLVECGTANVQGMPPQAQSDPCARALHAESGGSEESTQAHDLDQDVSQ